MKKRSCEIEAVGINYKIYRQKREKPFKIFNKNQQEVVDHQLLQQQQPSTKFQLACPGIRHVLKDVNCKAKPWEILAIVGPSGAGKSSLLEILTGKLTPQTGSIFVNKTAIDRTQFRKISGYVTQNDTLFPLLTVEETLIFSAKLRLRLPPAQLSVRVKSLIQELGLEHVAMVRVGDNRARGISGGKRRRVSIGVDVIHDPKVLILDEPTSGLDSTPALQIIDMLKVMAETGGRTIILSIHRPGFRIVKSFNSMLLLANGSVLHQGTVDQLGADFKDMGLQLRLHVNIVEFAIELIEAIQTTAKGTGTSSRTGNRDSRTKVLQKHIQNQGAVCMQDNPDAGSRLVLGSIFRNAKDDLAGAEEKVGFYRVSSYAIANGLVHLPFLLILAILFSTPLYWLVGLNPNFTAFIHFLLLIWLILYTANSVVVCFSALVPNFIIGNSVISGVMGSFFLFSGYFISKHGIPKYWIFMHYISLFKYPFEGFLINEFSGKCVEYMLGGCMVTGEVVLREEGYGEESRWTNVLVMVGFILVYRFVSYVIL
ncbi:ABC transporter G family member 5 [Hibiscus syriacus]|uniref:ABC transporter G family member 5 n=1 Tax=Hibiscus syriacus TaxID=106335 RepID=A0A6A2X4A9_HIBSY|nr:ABC transporter G family member 5 [Hibiscus syriacus]